MSYNSLEIELLFDKVWELYPNKAKESSARKAFKVLLKTGGAYKEFENAVKIYALESRSDEYHYHFSNFINEDHWKDCLDAHKSPEEYIARLERVEKLAYEVIDKWNAACKKHWCPVLSPQKKVALVLQALRDDDFKQHWEVALQKAEGVFRFKFRDGDWRQNIILSLRWFCNTHADKHTVLRLLENEFGYEQREEKVKERKSQTELTEQERSESIDLWNEVMGEDWGTIEKEDEFDLH